jgi:SAM-dependent methyltransferase
MKGPMPDPRSVQDRITGFWGSIAEGYEAHGGNVPAPGSAEAQAWVRAIAERLPPPPADVLDIATGTGFVAAIAARLGHRVTAIDLAEPMLAVARVQAEGLGIAFQTGDAVAPPFGAAAFDAITNRHLFWTLRDPEAALAAWRRLLRPGGRLVIVDGFWFDTTSEDGEAAEAGCFEQFYTPDTKAALPGWRYARVEPVAALVKGAGFSQVDVARLDEIHRLAETPPGPTPAYAITAHAP